MNTCFTCLLQRPFSANCVQSQDRGEFPGQTFGGGESTLTQTSPGRFAWYIFIAPHRVEMGFCRGPVLVLCIFTDGSGFKKEVEKFFFLQMLHHLLFLSTPVRSKCSLC